MGFTLSIHLFSIFLCVILVAAQELTRAQRDLQLQDQIKKIIKSPTPPYDVSACRTVADDIASELCRSTCVVGNGANETVTSSPDDKDDGPTHSIALGRLACRGRCYLQILANFPTHINGTRHAVCENIHYKNCETDASESRRFQRIGLNICTTLYLDTTKSQDISDNSTALSTGTVEPLAYNPVAPTLYDIELPIENSTRDGPESTAIFVQLSNEDTVPLKPSRDNARHTSSTSNNGVVQLNANEFEETIDDRRRLITQLKERQRSKRATSISDTETTSVFTTDENIKKII